MRELLPVELSQTTLANDRRSTTPAQLACRLANRRGDFAGDLCRTFGAGLLAQHARLSRLAASCCLCAAVLRIAVLMHQKPKPQVQRAVCVPVVLGLQALDQTIQKI